MIYHGESIPLQEESYKVEVRQRGAEENTIVIHKRDLVKKGKSSIKRAFSLPAQLLTVCRAFPLTKGEKLMSKPRL
jgi:hypothetical protein